MASVSVVITAFNQGELIAEAVASAWAQTSTPAQVIVVDDGSNDPSSLDVLRSLDADVISQPNSGVSVARNTGFGAATTDLVVVLDGDDRLAPSFIDRTASLLDSNPAMVAASSWMHLHGVVDAVVKPAGGAAVDFLARNACPATALVRRTAWQRCGGYAEGMRSGFEDWDFFLSLLSEGGTIGIVPEPLVEYRTAPASANIRSMSGRVDLYGLLIDRHRPLFETHMRDALLALESRAILASARAEELMVRHPEEPIGDISYGDGGMASAVRIASARAAR